MHFPFAVIVIAAASAAAIVPAAHAQIMDPVFEADYTAVDLGTVPGVPGPYGGVTFLAGDSETLLIGGSANAANGAIYSIDVVRGCTGRIVGFAGTATLFATAPQIDGGLAYGPGGVLFYTGYSQNLIGQIMPGSTEPDRVDDATALGIAASLGTLQFVPEGYAGAGRLKLASYNAWTWYDATVTPDGSGTYDIVDVTQTSTVSGGPEGIVYVADFNPQFSADSVLVSEWGAGLVGAYEIDASGDPILASRRDFVTGLSGAEGATIDPATGDFIFSTFGGGDRVVAVRGFLDPCRGDLDDDAAVTIADLLDLLSRWGNTCDPADLDDSETVEIGDLLILLAQWGPCP